tara:strand:+ start:133 stop:513 length:381 start_codon:yes stop_codon:yes gene_type:complete
MPRKTIGPFSSLANIPPLDVGTADPEDMANNMYLLHDALEAEGCRCDGLSRPITDPNHGTPRDADWGDDISELITRCYPHEINGKAADGTPKTLMVGILLETLRVEVDDNNEICCWIYEEPELTED